MDSRSVEKNDNISSEEDTNLLQYVSGMNYVRPPTLNFKKIKNQLKII